MSTVLLIDATTLARDSLARLLEHEGLAVIEAGNGREAWAMMYHATPDLVLLDWAKPGIDGVTFLTTVRHSALWHRLPVIVLVNEANCAAATAHTRELGVNDLVVQDRSGLDDLLSRVRHHLAAEAVAGGAALRSYAS